MYYCGENNSENYKKLKKSTSSGSLVTNDFLICFIAITAGFGGVGFSGKAKVKGFEGFEQCSHRRVVIETPKTDYLDLECKYRGGQSELRLLRTLNNWVGARTLQGFLCVLKSVVLVVLVLGLGYYLKDKVSFNF